MLRVLVAEAGSDWRHMGCETWGQTGSEIWGSESRLCILLEGLCDLGDDTASSVIGS